MSIFNDLAELIWTRHTDHILDLDGMGQMFTRMFNIEDDEHFQELMASTVAGFQNRLVLGKPRVMAALEANLKEVLDEAEAERLYCYFSNTDIEELNARYAKAWGKTAPIFGALLQGLPYNILPIGKTLCSN